MKRDTADIVTAGSSDARFFGYPLTRRAKTVLLAILTAMAALSVTRGILIAISPAGSLDLGIVLKGAELLLTENPYADVRDLPQLPTIGEQESQRNPWPAVPAHVPSVLILFWPFVWTSWPVSKVLWLVANVLLAFPLLYLAFKRFLPGRARWIYAAITCLFFMSMPVRVIIANGQHLIVSLFFFLLALEFADRNKSVPAGLALAVALIKYSVIIFLLPIMILRRQWGTLSIAVGIHLIISLAISAYLNVPLQDMLATSLRLSALHLGSGLIDLFSLSTIAGLGALLPTAIVAILLGMMAWLSITKKVADEQLFVAAACYFAVLLTYHRGYDFAVLLIPALVALNRWPSDRPFAFFTVGAIATVWFVFSILPYLGLSPYGGGYRWLMATFCYGALAVSFYALLGPAIEKHGTAEWQ